MAANETSRVQSIDVLRTLALLSIRYAPPSRRSTAKTCPVLPATRSPPPAP